MSKSCMMSIFLYTILLGVQSVSASGYVPLCEALENLPRLPGIYNIPNKFTLTYDLTRLCNGTSSHHILRNILKGSGSLPPATVDSMTTSQVLQTTQVTFQTYYASRTDQNNFDVTNLTKARLPYIDGDTNYQLIIEAVNTTYNSTYYVFSKKNIVSANREELIFRLSYKDSRGEYSTIQYGTVSPDGSLCVTDACHYPVSGRHQYGHPLVTPCCKTTKKKTCDYYKTSYKANGCCSVSG